MYLVSYTSVPSYDMDITSDFAVTQLTRENFRDVISKISDDSSREEALMSVLEQVKW